MNQKYVIRLEQRQKEQEEQLQQVKVGKKWRSKLGIGAKVDHARVAASCVLLTHRGPHSYSTHTTLTAH